MRLWVQPQYQTKKEKKKKEEEKGERAKRRDGGHAHAAYLSPNDSVQSIPFQDPVDKKALLYVVP